MSQKCPANAETRPVMRNTSSPSRAGVEVAAVIGADSLMHPTLYPAPFTAAGWVFENKFDGFRALARSAAIRQS